MPESVNYCMPIPSPAGQLFHADPRRNAPLCPRNLDNQIHQQLCSPDPAVDARPRQGAFAPESWRRVTALQTHKLL